MTPLPDDFIFRPFAHRGLHDRTKGVIENSRAAIEAAVSLDYGVELDLQLSADGEAMVFHDDDLDRLTRETGPVSKKSALELGGMLLNDCAEGIPTLQEILDIVRGRIPLLIELKDQSRCLGEVDGALERRTAQLLAAYSGPTFLMSFNPKSVAHCKVVAPNVPRGRVTCDFCAEDWPYTPRATADKLVRIDDLDSLDACFISHDYGDLERTAVAATRQSGRAVLSWTIRSAEEEALARRHADNVTFEGYLA